MNLDDWISLLQPGTSKGLLEEESYPKFIEMIRELDEERGRSLTDKQVTTLRTVILRLIQAGASVKYCEDE